MKTAAEALALLREGNHRFVNNLPARNDLANPSSTFKFIEQQEPHTIIVGCSDSRVPAELVFDQGIGDLFVVRVAGNVVATSQVGSVEFAALEFGSRLVVVLGHTRCGAVAATLNSLRQPSVELPENILAIVDRIKPHVADVLDDAGQNDQSELEHLAGRANVQIDD